MDDTLELCELCNELEDNHTGKHHLFSSDGSLVGSKSGTNKSVQSSAKKDVGQRPAEEEAGVSEKVEQPGSNEGPVEHLGIPTPEMAPGPFPADPVLRMALITKGLLTPDDLTAAENVISASSGRPIASVVRKRSLSASRVAKDADRATPRRKPKEKLPQ